MSLKIQSPRILLRKRWEIKRGLRERAVKATYLCHVIFIEFYDINIGFQYELKDKFVDFLRKNKSARNDETRWICIYLFFPSSLQLHVLITSSTLVLIRAIDTPTKIEMWKNSVVSMVILCIIGLWIASVILLHLAVHHRRVRHFYTQSIFYYGYYVPFLFPSDRFELWDILICIPSVCVITWLYYNILLGKFITTVVLTEKRIFVACYFVVCSLLEK